MLAAEFGTGQVFWSIIWFTLFFMWIWLAISVISDVFRSHDLGGFAKFLWILFIVLLPYLGVFAYLIARGSNMSEHAIEDAEANERAARAYIRHAAGTNGPSVATELQLLANLRDNGALTAEEFEAQKARLLSS